MEKCFCANSQKKVGAAVLILDKIDIRAKNITRVKEAHFLNIKGSAHQEEMIILTYLA